MRVKPSTRMPKKERFGGPVQQVLVGECRVAARESGIVLGVRCLGDSQVFAGRMSHSAKSQQMHSDECCKANSNIDSSNIC